MGKKFVSVLILTLCLFLLMSCNSDDNNDDEEKVYYTVTFDTGCDIVVPAVTVEKGKLLEVQNVTRDGYSFLGWYLNDELFDFSKEIESDLILIAKWEILQENVVPNNIVISGKKEVYLGYTNMYEAVVYPVEVKQDVTWVSLNLDVITIDEEGYAYALSLGTARIKAISNVDPTVESEYFEIKVIEDEVDATTFDMQGYEIEIMQTASAFSDIDPHLDEYPYSDKDAKIKAWDEAETKYNCKVSVIAYHPEMIWGEARINKIIEWGENGTPEADIYTVSSAWLSEFVKSDVALDVTEYYEKYGKGQMENVLREMGTIDSKLYTVSTGINLTANYVDHGLFYNYDKIAEYGIEDPATLFNEGKWTYSGFESWAKELQTHLGEGEYAIGGHSFYYWLGMSASAGVKLIDMNDMRINIDSEESKNALALLNSLVNDGAMNPRATWAEGSGDTGFQDQTTMMTSGRYWFVSTSSLWNNHMWGEDKEANIGYVPYPYPDNMDKKDIRLAVTGGTVYMYAKGRTYGDGFGAENVYKVMTDIYLNTNRYMYFNSLYDAKEVLRESIAKYIKNEASIEAMIYYNHRKIMYDITETVYGSSTKSIFIDATKKVVYDGADYQTAFDELKDDYISKINELYGSLNL